VAEPAKDPCLARLERDLVSSDFESGVRAGLWRALGLDWPHLLLAVRVGDGNELVLRVFVDGYPATPPGGQPWDLARNALLDRERWPTGGTAPQVFNWDWAKSYGFAPYMACDRGGLKAHRNWATEHPERAWNPGRTIAFYAREIHHELLGATLPQKVALP
jgi:hypothetical protein